MDVLSVTRDELWAIRDYCRNHTEQGVEWDRGFMRRRKAKRSHRPASRGPRQRQIVSRGDCVL